MSDRIISALIGAIAAILVGLIPIALRRHKEQKSLACRQANFERRIGEELSAALERIKQRDEAITSLQEKMDELMKENAALHGEIRFLRSQLEAINPRKAKATR